MAEPKTTLSVDESGVALILLDYKPLNALHPQRKALQCFGQHRSWCLLPQAKPQTCLQHAVAVLRSLFENLKRAHSDSRVKAIVVAGSNNNFSPGFDIQQFQNQVRVAEWWCFPRSRVLIAIDGSSMLFQISNCIPCCCSGALCSPAAVALTTPSTMHSVMCWRVDPSQLWQPSMA
jgi:hypothetical protein